MTIMIAGTAFANAEYDALGDVLYLDVEGYEGPPAGAHASVEGHGIEFDESGRLIAMTLVGVRWHLQRDGVLTITLRAEDLRQRELAALASPTAQVSEAELAPALQSVA
jgi:hypothetical protein